MKQVVIVETDWQKDTYCHNEVVIIRLPHPLVWISKFWPRNYRYEQHLSELQEDYNSWVTQDIRVQGFRTLYDMNRWYVYGSMKIDRNPSFVSSWNYWFTIEIPRDGHTFRFRYDEIDLIKIYKKGEWGKELDDRRKDETLFVRTRDVTIDELEKIDLYWHNQDVQMPTNDLVTEPNVVTNTCEVTMHGTTQKELEERIKSVFTPSLETWDIQTQTTMDSPEQTPEEHLVEAMINIEESISNS